MEDVNDGLILGQWGEMMGRATLAVETEGEVSAFLSSRVTLLEVVDLNGLPVPMARICTGSGSRYGL